MKTPQGNLLKMTYGSLFYPASMTSPTNQNPPKQVKEIMGKINQLPCVAKCKYLGLSDKLFKVTVYLLPSYDKYSKKEVVMPISETAMAHPYLNYYQVNRRYHSIELAFEDIK